MHLLINIQPQHNYIILCFLGSQESQYVDIHYIFCFLVGYSTVQQVTIRLLSCWVYLYFLTTQIYSIYISAIAQFYHHCIGQVKFQSLRHPCLVVHVINILKININNNIDNISKHGKTSIKINFKIKKFCLLFHLAKLEAVLVLTILKVKHCQINPSGTKFYLHRSFA